MGVPDCMDNDASFILLVSLFVVDGQEAAFQAFETKAAAIMKRYGGHIDLAFRPTDSLSGEELPHEVHVVSFPSQADFDRYQRDPDVLALAALRRSAIAKTQILAGSIAQPDD